eukprot:c19865_g1_i1.p1 GENE.c19865_g1_i1~~c19865_g1_i1.p1  ORF type:complete len:266 (-),score=59.88 c19865_g1_i1:90-887(-)
MRSIGFPIVAIFVDPSPLLKRAKDLVRQLMTSQLGAHYHFTYAVTTSDPNLAQRFDVTAIPSIVLIDLMHDVHFTRPIKRTATLTVELVESFVAACAQGRANKIPAPPSLPPTPEMEIPPEWIILESLSAASFGSYVLEHEGAVVVVCVSATCTQCFDVLRNVRIVRDSLGKNSNVRFAQIDVVAHGISQQYEVVKLPTVFLFDEHKQHHQLPSFEPETIRDFITQNTNLNIPLEDETLNECEARILELQRDAIRQAIKSQDVQN